MQLIGEAAARLGHEFQEDHPDIPWAEIVAMRNILVHDYFGIDLEEGWSAIERDLPGLKTALLGLVDVLEDEEI